LELGRFQDNRPAGTQDGTDIGIADVKDLGFGRFPALDHETRRSGSTGWTILRGFVGSARERGDAPKRGKRACDESFHLRTASLDSVERRLRNQ
jgi:hypothetical protein